MAYGMLLSSAGDMGGYDLQVLEYSTPEIHEATKKMYESDAVQFISGHSNVKRIEEDDKKLLEGFFGRPISVLALYREADTEKSDILDIYFDDGLAVTAFGSGSDGKISSCDLKKTYDILVSQAPTIKLEYQVNSKGVGVWAEPLFDQIPESVAYPNLAESVAKNGGKGYTEESLRGGVAINTGKIMSERIKGILEPQYNAIQKKLQKGDLSFGITVEHVPPSKWYPLGTVICHSTLNTSISKPIFDYAIDKELAKQMMSDPQHAFLKDFIDADEEKIILMNRDLHEVTSKFDEIEQYVRGVYEKLDIRKLESVEGL